MAKKKEFVDIDFNQNQLLNPVLQNLPEDPSTGVEGQKYFNTTNHIERTYRNGAWKNATDEYELPAASTNTRGGVKVGSHLNVTNTDVLNADEASTTQKGVVEIATDEEVTTGTDTERVVTPHGLDIVTEPIKGDIEDLQEGNFNGDWRTPTKDEWDYVIKTRSASTVSGTPNARFIAAQVNSVNGLIILPDVFSLPSGITMSYINNTSPNYGRNIYTLEQWSELKDNGCVFLPVTGERYDTNVWYISEKGYYWSSVQNANVYSWYFYFGSSQPIDVTCYTQEKFYGCAVRLIKQDDNGIFSISANTKCTIASSNLQYHCLNKEWRFAPNAYDVIGSDNANIAENYNGYIDLFGFGTSGWNSGAVCYQPWSVSTTPTDYIGHSLTGDYQKADWGYNIKKQLQDVAFSGSYNDLSNKPIIPVGIPSGGNAGQVLSKASATDYDVHWNNQVIIYPSAYCTTNATSADKKASCSLYTLNPNSYVHVLLGTTNTVQSALTLNINSTGAKPIYINGNPSSSTNYTLPAGTYIVFYNGTNYYFRTDGKLTTLNGAFGGSYNDLTNKPAAIPTPTSADADKLLSVNSSGEYELITIINSELIPY